MADDPYANFADAASDDDPYAAFADAPAEKPAKRSFVQELKRQAGLGARALTQGVTDLAGLPLDVMAAVYNLGNQDPHEVTLDDGTKTMRGGPMEMPSSERERLLTQAGLPEPETATERVVNLAGRSAGGAGTVAKVASRLPGAISNAMAARPAMQVVSGATGGTSAGVARERGYGPWAQMGAGMLGSFLPALLTARMAPGAGVRSPEAQAEAAAGATAAGEANVTPGQAGAEASMNATPEMRIQGGGPNFGSVGEDASAGLNSTRTDMMNRGREIGMRMTPGQATGSRALQQLEAKLESQPMTSGPFNTIKANNSRVLNLAAARAIGETSDVVDSGVLARAHDRIGGIYENMADETPRPIDPQQFSGFISQLQEETRGLVQGIASHPLIEDLTRFATTGAANGRQLQSLGSKLGKAAFKNMTTQSGDRDLGIALYQAKDYVDDLLAQGISPERSTAFDAARGQYRNLMLLTQRVGVVNPSSGDVSGRSLANLLQSKDKRGFLYGRNRSPMYEAARFSQAFAPIVGDSGTATRMPLQSLSDMVMRIPMNVATRAYTSTPGVNMALRTQAGARALAALPRNGVSPTVMMDAPAAGVAGAQASQMTEEERRRALIAELLQSAQ